MQGAKKIIFLSFEGKNNKTESNYFRHFKPSNENYILKTFSSGCTDVKNMINSSKRKAARYGFSAKDFLFIFSINRNR